MIVFSSTPGVVSAVMTGFALPFAVGIGGGNGAPEFPMYRLAKAVLTGFSIDNESGLSASHTLRDRIYVYTHGERSGTVMVSGTAFGGVCDDDGPRFTGIDAVYAYYERVRASTEEVPVRLVFGPRTTLYGFMSKMRLGLEDPAAGVGSFQFQFLSMPRNAGRYGYKPPLPWDRTGGTAVVESLGTGGAVGAVGPDFGGGGDF